MIIKYYKLLYPVLKVPLKRHPKIHTPFAHFCHTSSHHFHFAHWLQHSKKKKRKENPKNKDEEECL